MRKSAPWPLICLLAAGCAQPVGSIPTDITKHQVAAKPTVETTDMVEIPGGRFELGTGDIYPEELPKREVDEKSFYIDRHEVTNAQFAKFVKATGYVTTAAGERLAFAIMLNNYEPPAGGPGASADLDAIAVLLANYRGRG